MNSLLMRTVNSASNRRNMLVRESLQQQLNTAVIEVQSAPGALEGQAVEICDEALALCSALEAVFLHGLKDSLLNRVTEALSGPDYDAMPQPSFWGPLLVVSHRGIIDQIQSLTQVTTEVGYCRAWIRLALNEGLLSSYLASIRRDGSGLKPYYNRSAFIRDRDLVEVAQRLVESIDGIRFELASNSSLLNFWSSTPLLMAAIWSPPLKSCPVFSAVDIAKTISSERTTSNEDNYEEIETTSSIGSLSSFTSSLNNLSGISEDEALRIILGRKSRPSHLDVPTAVSATAPVVVQATSWPTGEEARSAQGSPREPAKIEEPTEAAEASDPLADEDRGEIEATEAAAVGDSQIGKPGWSTALEDAGGGDVGESLATSSALPRESEQTDQQPQQQPQQQQSPGDAPSISYEALLQSYHTGEYEAPNLQELLDKYPVRDLAGSSSSSGSLRTVDPATAEPRELQNFDEQLGRLSREKGLDLQNYSCLECGHMIGLKFDKANVCCFTGNYYCDNCMASDDFLIPARVVHNWDLKRYPVSEKAAKYLSECATLLDLKIVNPRIYSAVDSMAQLQRLRVQLNLLRAYLFNCREPIIESFQKMVAPRDYLYQHIHQYSVSDFVDIPNGTLALQLQKFVEFAKSHVLNCWLCSQKGFICEVCRNPKIIYPFDVDTTYRCGACNAVYHSKCLNAKNPCPRCERRRRRMDLPLPDFGNPEPLKETTLSSPIATS